MDLEHLQRTIVATVALDEPDGEGGRIVAEAGERLAIHWLEAVRIVHAGLAVFVDSLDDELAGVAAR